MCLSPLCILRASISKCDWLTMTNMDFSSMACSPYNLQLLICPMPNSVAVYRIFFNLYLFNYLGNPEFFWIKSPNAIVGLFGLCPLMCHTDILSKPNSKQWVYWRGLPPTLVKKAWTNVLDTGNLPSLLGRPECIIKCMIQASLCILYYKIYPLLLLSFN